MRFGKDIKILRMCEKETDFVKMKDWLGMCLEKKQGNLPLLNAVNEDLVCAYSYKQLAKQYENVLKG